MIYSVLIVNNGGKPRLCRFYEETGLDQQQLLLQKVHELLTKRPDESCCCFLDEPGLLQGRKLVYRHFATLYFCFIVDDAESELGVLDLIQVFVQVLDSCFENVCELDLIYHFDRVNYIIDEIVMAGMVLETNADLIITAVKETKKLESE